MDPAGFGAMVIAPTVRFLGLFGPSGRRAAGRPRLAGRFAAGLPLVPWPLSARLTERAAPGRAVCEPAHTAHSYAWPDAYAAEVPLREKPYPLRKGRA
ncbi:hypothetical protein OV450_4490 [Actinobacteria bacterium OV450]|nr:hypothetical protein OV450_4490 [Actinobacteria bacterium OV450]